MQTSNSTPRGRFPVALAAAALAVSCQGQRPMTPEPAAPLAVKVDVLGAGCAAALTLATEVTNLSGDAVRLTHLALSYSTQDPRCRSHVAPIDGSLAESLAGGQSRVVHRLDPKGTVCEAPTGALDCEWTVTADVTTSAGLARGSATFVSTGPGRGWSSDLPQAELRSPGPGAALAGIVRVQPNYFEGCGAVNSARMIVFLFRGTQVVAASHQLDLGDFWALDTTQFANGDYALGAMQNRCQVLGPIEPVSIRN